VPDTEAPFDRVIVIYNPNSTGNAPRLAEELKADLGERLPGLAVALQPTEHAGHARTLAADAARQGRPLIVSVSGDGGYNEVVNGIMDAADRTGDSPAVAAVKAAGNANDHRRATKERPLLDAIALGRIVRTDLLRLTIDRPTTGIPAAEPVGTDPVGTDPVGTDPVGTDPVGTDPVGTDPVGTDPVGTDPVGTGSGQEVRYAHSYIGVGLTPVVAVDLEKGNKGSLRELVTVVRTFARFRPFEIELESGERTTIDSLLFANIPEMAKVATLSDNGDPDDGRFEIIALPHLSKWRVLMTALRAATGGLGEQPTARTYRFSPTQPMPMQIDGELLQLGAGDQVRVDIAPRALPTIR
jgi:diacylglycerol kinase (ATP)